MRIQDIINLSELLGEMGKVKRATDLPNGEAESDSHHSFSLALISYHIVKNDCPELDADKVLLFALCHDLLEIVTGDDDTLHFTAEQHAAKQAKEETALKEFDTIFAEYPELKAAMHDYDRLDTPEAATVFVLDKACTTWTWIHHSDLENHKKNRSVSTKSDVEAWASRQNKKFAKRLKVQPPKVILDVYRQSFEELKSHFEA
jgi:5'-deoxynucleotidase YfbR-like HD superfamily hydrolase